MIIYHGSLEKVENPEIRLPNRTLDYGFGFYTTTSYKQAESWVKRRMEEKKVPKGFINIYEFNEKAMKSLNSLIFEVPTEEWVDFVMNILMMWFMVLLPMIRYMQLLPCMKVD